MTRVLVQRGSTGSSTSSANQNRPSTSASVSTPSSSSSASPQQQVTNSSQAVSALKDENMVDEVQDQVAVDEQSELVDFSEIRIKETKSGDFSSESLTSDHLKNEKNVDDEKVLLDEDMVSGTIKTGLNSIVDDNVATVGSSTQMITGSSYPPPPPVPPPKPSPGNSNSQRFPIGDSNAVRIESSRRAAGLPVSIRSSSTGSRPSSPRSHCEGEGYNSADEQIPNFSSNYDDAEREHQFEIDLRRHKGLEVRKMLEDGNCLFRAVADQVYGDSDQYGTVRQMCIDYMEKERDHFSQFMTESFTSYCKRKRRDKVYGNNMEIQALSEMYNRPIHIYSYSTEPINIFQGSYDTDTAPIRLSYHRGNHYNSLVDPRRPTIGVGLGFSSLQGNNIDKDQVKAAIKAQQDQQINNALLAEGRFYSDLELTEKEIERNVMEASRAEYIAGNFKQQIGYTESSSTSRAEPSSSAARPLGSDSKLEGGSGPNSSTPVLSDEIMQVVMSMGFSYFQVVEAFSIFGNDVDSMVCYLIETNGSGRRKGKATE